MKNLLLAKLSIEPSNLLISGALVLDFARSNNMPASLDLITSPLESTTSGSGSLIIKSYFINFELNLHQKKVTNLSHRIFLQNVPIGLMD